MCTESYVVRIYRRGADEDTNQWTAIAIAGTIENVDSGKRRYFRSVDELWRVLANSEIHPRPDSGVD